MDALLETYKVIVETSGMDTAKKVLSENIASTRCDLASLPHKARKRDWTGSQRAAWVHTQGIPLNIRLNALMRIQSTYFM